MRLGEEATFKAVAEDSGGFIAHLVLARAEVDNDVLRLGTEVRTTITRGENLSVACGI